MSGLTRRVRGLWRSVFLSAAFLLLLPALARAQATLTGTVADSSGAVLPGVTVEAASPVLIEKVRSATTDGAGLYRIVDLRPGAYSLTFTLPGFTVVKRENVQVSGVGNIQINAEMRVGAVQETITVTGETPVVDVQSTRRQAAIDSDTVNSIPVARGYGNLLATVPGIQSQALAARRRPLASRRAFSRRTAARGMKAAFRSRA